jgi:hypothetical protein
MMSLQSGVPEFRFHVGSIEGRFVDVGALI